MYQVIYTSCKRGINGVNDGQQIYSYSEGFTNLSSANLTNIKSLFCCQLPRLPVGVTMNEEVAAAQPQCFSYEIFSSEDPENSIAAFSLRTYLGRDYMGSAGRFGNHLSHCLIATRDEFSSFPYYPAELYKSTFFRSKMHFEEVNSPEKPELLKIPSPVPGNIVTFEKVIEFLNSGNRSDIFISMLDGFFNFEKKRKRLVICDAEENTALWIGAISYVFPKENASNISFSTYEYDPALSPYQICGVLSEGTKYIPSEETRRTHFVFDMFEELYPKELYSNELNDTSFFFDFIKAAFFISENCLALFHNFLKDYNYKKADYEYINGYALYCFISDSILNSNEDVFKKAISFNSKYAKNNQVSKRVLFKLIRERDNIISLDSEYINSISKYLIETAAIDNDKFDSIGKLLGDILFSSAENPNDKNGDAFLKLSKTYQKTFAETNFDVSSFLQNNASTLRENLCGTIAFAYPNFSKNIKNLLHGFWCAYSHAPDALAEFTFSIEESLIAKFSGVLRNYNEYSEFLEIFRLEFSEYIATNFYDQRNKISDAFIKHKKNEWLCSFYNELFGASSNLSLSEKLFNEIVAISRNFEITGASFENYYKLLINSGAKSAGMLKNLAYFIFSYQIETNFIHKYIKDTIDIMPSLPIIDSSASFLNVSTIYLYNVFNIKISGKHAVYFAYTIAADYSADEKIKKYIAPGGIDLEYIINEKELFKYLANVLSKTLTKSICCEDFIILYRSFSIPEKYCDIFNKEFCRYALSKESTTSEKYIEFLKFIKSLENKPHTQNRISYFFKQNLSKNRDEKKLSQSLTEEFFEKNPELLNVWKIVSGHSGVSNFFGNIFKRK